MMQMGANCWERVRSRFVLVVNFKEGPSGGVGGGMGQIILIKRMEIFPDQWEESSSEKTFGTVCTCLPPFAIPSLFTLSFHPSLITILGKYPPPPPPIKRVRIKLRGGPLRTGWGCRLLLLNLALYNDTLVRLSCSHPPVPVPSYRPSLVS